MLVKLYDKHKLYALSKEQKPLARAELSKTVCSLLEMDISEHEMEMIADVLIALLRQAEIDLREALSERLCALDNIPLRLVLEFANDEISVARPILSTSEVLKDDDLIYIIKSKSSKYWQAIATRKTMSEKVINVLADTKDLATALRLVDNENIQLNTHALAVLSDMAQGNESLAQPLLRRDEVTPELAEALYRHVGDALKQHIIEKFSLNSHEMTHAIDETISDLTREEINGYDIDYLAQAEDLKAKGLLNETLMIKTLKRGQHKLFVSLLAKFSGLKQVAIMNILREPSGRNLALICRANGVLKSDFTSLYLLTSHFRGPGKQISTQTINEALGHFESIKPHVARKIIETHLTSGTNATEH